MTTVIYFIILSAVVLVWGYWQAKKAIKAGEWMPPAVWG